MTLEEGGRIGGEVADAPSSSGYLFYLTRADDSARWALGYGGLTNQEFDFEGIPEGDWKVGAWPNGGGYPEEAPSNTVWYPSTLDWGDAGTISIRDGSTVTGILITLP